MSILEAVKEVMRLRGSAMTVAEVYGDVIAAGLYTFHAYNPHLIVAGQIRRHCIGLVFPTASQSKHFRIVDDNKCYFLDTLTAAWFDQAGCRAPPAAQGGAAGEGNVVD
jgi:restriction system protein